MTDVIAHVATQADLGRFTQVAPGAVFHIIDTNRLVQPDGKGGWTDAPQSRAETRALVDGHWPYVVGSDMVVAYPEVSRDLANKAAALDANWKSYRDGKAWWTWNGTVGQLISDGGAMVRPVAGDAGAVWWQPGNPARLNWFHGGAWRTLFTIDWATYSSPNEPQIYSNDTRWLLYNPRNRFTGVFLPVGRATRAAVTTATRAALATATAPAGGEPLPADAWDLAATVQDLVSLVNSLADRIEALEAKP